MPRRLKVGTVSLLPSFYSPLAGRTRRTPLAPPVPGGYTFRPVRVAVPKWLPKLHPVYATIDRNRINVHSRNQLRSLVAVGEHNRRRYQERKQGKRRAWHGQVASTRRDTYGMIRFAHSRRLSNDRIEQTAMVQRALELLED